MRGRRVSRRLALRALVIEQRADRPPARASTTSYAENVIRGLGKAAGDRVLGKTQRTLDGLASKADRMRAQQAAPAHPGRIPGEDFVAHPDGGVRTVTETVERPGQAARARSPRTIDAGSYRHRRLPKALRRVPVTGLRRRRAAAAVLLLRRDERRLDAALCRPP